MKKFEITLSQTLKGYYIGKLEIEATTIQGAHKIFKGMTLEEIDQDATWEQGDQYDGDINTIEAISEFIEID